MNVSANYMREHVKPDNRIHCATICPGAPKMVPDARSVWYYICTPERKDVDEVYSWLCDCAKGAAAIAHTTFDIEFLTGCSEVMPNDVPEKVMLGACKDTTRPNSPRGTMAFGLPIFDLNMAERCRRALGPRFHSNEQEGEK